MANTPEIFGFEGGYMAGQQAYQEKQLFGMRMQEGALTIEKDKLDLENARILQSRQMEFSKRLQQRINAPQANADGTPAAGGNQQIDDLQQVAGLAHTFYEAGQDALLSGLPKEGAEYIKTGSTLMHQQSDVAKAQAAIRIQKMQHASNLLGDVKSADEWQAAVMQFQMLYPEDAQDPGLSKIIKAPYDPRMVKALHDSVLTEINKSKLTLDEAHKLEADANTADRKADKKLKESQTRYDDDRDIALRKTGALGLKPKPADLQAVTDRITRDFGNPRAVLTPSWKEDIRSDAMPIAERMLQLERSGMSRTAAIDKAMQEAKTSGSFAGKQPAVRGPGSLEQPLPIPRNPKPEQMQDNRAYKFKTKDGDEITGVWNAKSKNFDIVEEQKDDEPPPDPDDDPDPDPDDPDNQPAD